MIGLDTNLLVRLFANDSPGERARVIALLDGLPADERVYVSVLVVAELIWTLRRGYGFEPNDIATVLRRLTEHPRVETEADLLREAAHRSREEGGRRGRSSHRPPQPRARLPDDLHVRSRRRSQYRLLSGAVNRGSSVPDAPKPAADADLFGLATGDTIRLALCLVAAIMPGVALAADWSRYTNDRFGYGVDIPPGFSPIREADNSDGGTSKASSGHADLAVWGTNLLDTTFAAEVGSRISGDAGDGWTIGYRVVTGSGASWSGTKGDRILYARAVPKCGDQAAFARVEYDASAKATFDPLVSRLARSLKAAGGC